MFEAFMNGSFPFRTMTLEGQGQVDATPDMALARLGVELTGADLASVQSQNAVLSQSVLNTLHRMGIDDIRTFQYTVDKYYQYDDGTPVGSGYTVRNIFEIRTKDTDRLGAVIDAAVNAGANSVELISFEVSDPEAFYRQALNLAVADAIEKAKSISEGLKTRVDPTPVKITETSIMPSPQPFQRELAATPVVPGNITIQAGVTAEFLY